MQKNKVFMILAAVIFVIGSAGVSAQSSQIIDNLLSAEAASFGESAYMVAVGSGLAADTVSVSEAVDIITKNGWNKSDRTAESPITLGEFSYMVMEALELDGGIMYLLLPSPRYAARELAFRGFITSEPHPGNKISGDDVLNILSLAVSSREAN